MGMASSQVRLLMITNRLHDIEYKAACIQNAKILLGMLEDDAYREYLAAQEGATTITIGGEAAKGTNFSDLVNGLGVYMTDANNNVYASSLTLQAYNAVVGEKKASTDPDNDFKKFAWYMDNGNTSYPSKAVKPEFEDKATGDNQNLVLGKFVEIDNPQYLEMDEEGREQSDAEDDDSPTKIPAKIYIFKEISATASATDKEGAMLYNRSDVDNITYPTWINNTEQVNGYTSMPSDSYSETGYINENGNWYLRYTASKQAEDWKTDNDPSHFKVKKTADNPDGKFYTNSEVENWNKFDKPDNTHRQVFNAISRAYADGKNVSAEDFDANTLGQKLESGEGGYKLQNTRGYSSAWSSDDGGFGVNYDPSNPFNYSVSTGQDKAVIAAASAKYENELRKIDRKEKQYDTELAKIETERNALTKEMDGLKKVIEDNVDRTFGLFS